MRQTRANAGPPAWLAHPQPQPGELLSSWLRRCSRANRVSFPQFLQLTLGEVRGDPDRGLPQETLTRVATSLAQPEWAVMALTLQDMEGRLVRRLSPGGAARWVVPSGPARWKVRLAGLPVCPDCLADGVPYLRLSWRCAFSPCCPVHQVLLVQHCPACQALTDPYRRTLWSGVHDQDRPFTRCWQCGQTLRGGTVPALPLASWTQQRFREALKDGEVVLGTRVVQSLAFAELAYGLLASLCRGSRTEQFRQRVAQAAQLELPVMGPGNTTCAFELLPVLEQMRALALLGWLLEDWPARFHWAARRSGTSCREFTPHLGTRPPAWCLEALSDPELRGQP